MKFSTRDLCFCAIGAALIAVCAWISIPAEVPFTLQTFAIFTVCGLLGGKRGTVSVLVYLLLGAVGVANVVLMSVTARTSEFGLRRALGCKRRWIFGQVFLEASLVCVVSGLLGFGLGAAGVAAMGFIDLPAGFAAPEVEWASAVLPGVLLLFVSLGAAAWPATRAARVTVVQALHGGGL